MKRAKNANGAPVWPLQAQCDAFYGNPRGTGDNYNHQWAAENLVSVGCPWPITSDGKQVPFIVIHKRCADSLKQVLGGIWDAVGKDQGAIETLHYNRYSGSFNYRPMRLGSALSMHAYGVAIDWDAEENPFHSTKHLFQDNSLIVTKFKEQNWIWGGDWSAGSIDAMHFQAARVHA
jgi:hypothetical protein